MTMIVCIITSRVVCNGRYGWCICGAKCAIGRLMCDLRVSKWSSECLTDANCELVKQQITTSTDSYSVITVYATTLWCVSFIATQWESDNPPAINAISRCVMGAQVDCALFDAAAAKSPPNIYVMSSIYENDDNESLDEETEIIIVCGWDVYIYSKSTV